VRIDLENPTSTDYSNCNLVLSIKGVDGETSLEQVSQFVDGEWVYSEEEELEEDVDQDTIRFLQLLGTRTKRVDLLLADDVSESTGTSTLSIEIFDGTTSLGKADLQISKASEYEGVIDISSSGRHLPKAIVWILCTILILILLIALATVVILLFFRSRAEAQKNDEMKIKATPNEINHQYSKDGTNTSLPKTAEKYKTDDLNGDKVRKADQVYEANDVPAVEVD